MAGLGSYVGQGKGAHLKLPNLKRWYLDLSLLSPLTLVLTNCVARALTPAPTPDMNKNAVSKPGPVLHAVPGKVASDCNPGAAASAATRSRPLTELSPEPSTANMYMYDSHQVQRVPLHPGTPHSMRLATIQHIGSTGYTPARVAFLKKKNSAGKPHPSLGHLVGAGPG